jgi:hypothetical protein
MHSGAEYPGQGMLHTASASIDLPMGSASAGDIPVFRVRGNNPRRRTGIHGQ